MTEVLNLDDLVTPAKKKLSVGGKQYEIKTMTVQAFIDMGKKIEEVAKDPSKEVEILVDLVKINIPDIPDDVLMALTLDQLNAIYKFAQAEADEAAEEAEGK